MTRLKIPVLIALLLFVHVATAAKDHELAVPVKVNGLTIPYSVFAVFVLPNTPINVALTDKNNAARILFQGKTVALEQASLRSSTQHGLQVLEILNTTTGETCRINVFTLVPAQRVDKNGRLNNYRIGSYPKEPLRGEKIYLPPPGFVEVTRENLSVAVSPHFTLGEFVAKQESGYPKYLVLQPALLLKLENILKTLNEKGHRTEGFVIMSGYRTPFYNRAIGNVQYSRHVWGGAADFYIDESPRDGRMDDMNKDGKVDKQDARWLANFVNEMSRSGSFGPRIGGIGVYGSNSAHGPFVHVDVRGSRARW